MPMLVAIFIHLGVILYELLTGGKPFRGNLRMLLHQVLEEEPKAPRTLNDRIPERNGNDHAEVHGERPGETISNHTPRR